MKKILLTFLSCLLILLAMAQPKPKPKQPAQSEMDKAMAEAMKDMSPEEQAEMKKMMKDIMPALNDVNAKTANYPEFTSNKPLVPKKDAARSTALSKKGLVNTEVAGYATGLYNKIMAKGETSEIAIAKKVITQTPKAKDIGSAAVLAMLQGHPQAALALSIKAVMVDPSNLNWQNNMAALLTSYGYPEQAMPLLKKLGNDLPVNSTVMNNIGQAWLTAGETDSAKRYFTFAYRINPLHPEAMLCGGLMDELRGDPIKAGKEYENALENSLNPFTEQVLKNHNKNYTPSDLDFEKIKRSIAIYEYFPKGWMQEPKPLSNDVRNHNDDYATKQAYSKMITAFTDKIQLMTDELSKDIEKIADKGEEEFIKEMASETMKGLSFMSKPAVVVLGVLSSYQLKWSLDFAEEVKKLTNWKQGLNDIRQKKIAAIYKQISDSKKTSCEQFKITLDAIENDYMRTVNTKLRDFLLKKTEEYRQWLNAWCTWNWYVSGNTKNYILIQDLGFTAHLASTYATIVETMETLPEHCKGKTNNINKNADAPEVPNFTCPAIVSIPAGPEWQQLVSASKDFNKNNYGIQKTDKPVPNTSVAIGTSKMVAQPGMTPSFKTANGSISPNSADVEAAMDKGLLAAFRRVNNKKTTDQQVADAVDKGLSDALKRVNEKKKTNTADQDDELMPLSDMPLDEMEPLGGNLLNKYKLVNELMKKMLTADCKNVKTPKENLKDQIDRMMKKVKELEAYENVIEEIKRLEIEIEQKEAVAQKREELRKKIEEFKKGSDELDRFEEMNEFLKRAEKFGKEMDDLDDKKAYQQQTQKIVQSAQDLATTQAALKDIQQNGLQPTISSGLQAPGTFTPQKGLFN